MTPGCNRRIQQATQRGPLLETDKLTMTQSTGVSTRIVPVGGVYEVCIMYNAYLYDLREEVL